MTSWPDYIAAAAKKAGGITKLAERAHLHRATLSKWRWEHVDPEAISIASIRAVAEAIGDDVRNAMRAAGRLDDEPPKPPTEGSGDRRPPLDELLRAIRESDLPQDRKLLAAAETIDLYRRRAQQ